MGKVKINLATGVEQEKNVINAFKVGNDSYAVLDNETTGSMGLPIILIAKINNNKLMKIIDQVEWQRTKENLKLIISNSPMEYIVIPSILTADEIYYTQLTLPQASFDAIKNNYKPVPDGGNSSILTEEPFVPTVEVTPIAPVTMPAPPIIPTLVTPIAVDPTIPVVVPPIISAEPVAVTPSNPAATQTIINPQITPIMPDAPVVLESAKTPSAPVISPVPSVPVIPVIPEIPVQTAAVVEPIAPLNPADTINQQPVTLDVKIETPVAPIVVPSPMPIPPVPVINENLIQPELINYKDLKETFMKSCENMFDALVKQIQNK